MLPNRRSVTVRSGGYLVTHQLVWPNMANGWTQRPTEETCRKQGVQAEITVQLLLYQRVHKSHLLYKRDTIIV